MGKATRTTKLLLYLGKRTEGGVNTGKRAYLDATAKVLTQARAFYLDFFLSHVEKLTERVSYYSEKHLEQRERLISPNESTFLDRGLHGCHSGASNPMAGMEFHRAFSRHAFCVSANCH